jgi:hypothetical protein
MKRCKGLRTRADNDTNRIKDEIQATLREIVILRDGGCILQGKGWQSTLSIPACNGYRKDGQLILQADHLITRGNSATYADSRLVVCLCKGHHGGFKKWNEARYNEIVRTLIGPERCKLWDACHAARYSPSRKTTSDWAKELAVLKQELRDLQQNVQLKQILYVPTE